MRIVKFGMSLQNQPPDGTLQKKSVLKSFTNFTGRHLCWSLQHWCLHVIFSKFIRTPILEEHLRMTASVLYTPNDTRTTVYIHLRFSFILFQKVFNIYPISNLKSLINRHKSPNFFSSDSISSIFKVGPSKKIVLFASMKAL